uniref:Right handed beta helix domain-containing protein n=1 Tax=Rhodosorus marinus TaxID=101924 RepID=A0A7S0BUE4_9RHOD|mmetsp:Transcript_9802/g.14255  ORF Transcript_9802/g.14255 Transcript_9802/m.14255 type:complete len:381 (+) Transcript_9802:473-1615(+)|eukprot:CAMPEP_0184754288 /NCGR_PEP_ID=MMETSP0315-20130426/44545_1 /TAXON_ID=101924 /ORGANISM="Rhodosorus marinus, Strain UTEX LB 2760" /LENGTH=380 /DNA_ID=CAMNT_0027233701 /DNA_START=393 /DNA_END=1535 /DNA_ORIENTATION=-
MNQKLLVVCLLVALFASRMSESKIIQLNCLTSLKYQLEKAPWGATMESPGNCEWIVAKTIYIKKPITIRGVHARLKIGVGKTVLMKVMAKGFKLYNFVFTGNQESVTQKQRASLLHITRGGFRVRKGVVRNSSRDGITVYPNRQKPTVIIGGEISDIEGHNNVRDVVSLSTAADGRIESRNILVENIKAFNCGVKGAVEVSDGVRAITIKKIFASRCRYGISIQDHGRSKFEINRGISISDLTVEYSRYGIVSETSDVDHSDISIARVTLRKCRTAMLLKNIRNLSVADVKVIDAPGSDSLVDVQRCSVLRVRKLDFVSGGPTRTAVKIARSKDIAINGIKLSGRFKTFYGVTLVKNQIPSGLRVSNFNGRVETKKVIVV